MRARLGAVRCGAVLGVSRLAAACGRDEAPLVLELPARAQGALEVLTSQASAPEWGVKYGDEFWRGRRLGAGDGVAELDLGDVVEPVTHAFAKAEDPSLPHVEARAFVVEHDGFGLRFSPNVSPAPDTPIGTRPTPDSATVLSLRTVGIDPGGHAVFRASARADEAMVLGNTVQLRRGVELVEHLEVDHEGAEFTWVLRERPSLPGDIVIHVVAQGLTLAQETATGAHYADASGVARVRITVPEELLASAAYPVAIDPTVSAEFGRGRRARRRGLAEQARRGRGERTLRCARSSRARWNTLLHLYGYAGNGGRTLESSGGPDAE